jgi:formate C-acetyltransferase
MRLNLSTVEGIEQKHFYEAAIITCEAAVAFAHRYAEAAERFDQYMYPYFKRDLEEGRLAESGAENLLKQLWLKINEVNYVLDSNTGRLIGGYPSRANLVPGGQTADGRDAVNELSYLCLKVTQEVELHQPSLSPRASGLPMRRTVSPP